MITVWITTRFDGLHRWPDAPPPCAFLADLHRHLFHVRVEWQVSHGNREREFFRSLDEVQSAINILQEYGNASTWSCEQWATEIMHAVDAQSVTVSEDGENGATVTND